MKDDTFYVYIYSRPDGTPFYVGKGKRDRISDLAPTRRTQHFINIVRKYGRENLILSTTPCASEESAFAFEMETIARLRSEGHNLVNLTDGGEGRSGMKASEATKIAFSEWHGVFYKLSEDAKQRILDGLAVGRDKCKAQWQTQEGREKRMTGIRKANFAKRTTVTCKCVECLVFFTTISRRAKCCSRKCEQRNRRAKQIAMALPKIRKPVSDETRQKMSNAKKGKSWTAAQKIAREKSLLGKLNGS